MLLQQIHQNFVVYVKIIIKSVFFASVCEIAFDELKKELHCFGTIVLYNYSSHYLFDEQFNLLIAMNA